MIKLNLELNASNGGTWGLSLDPNLNPNDFTRVLLVRVGTESDGYEMAPSEIDASELTNLNGGEYFGECKWCCYGEINLRDYLQADGTFMPISSLPFVKKTSSYKFLERDYINAGTYAAYVLNDRTAKYILSSNYCTASKVSKLQIQRNEDGSGRWNIVNLQYTTNYYNIFYLCDSPLGSAIEGKPGPVNTGLPQVLDFQNSNGSSDDNTSPMGSLPPGTLLPDKEYYAYAWYQTCQDAVYSVAPAATPQGEIPEPSKPDEYILTTEIYPNDPDLGAVNITPASGNQYSVGTQVEVRIDNTPPKGWKFLRWEVDGTGTKPSTTIVMDCDKTARAVFTRKEYEIELRITNDEGGYTIPEQDTVSYVKYGDNLKIDAYSYPGYKFKEWTGDFNSDNQSEELEDIETDMVIYATFEKIKYGLTLMRDGYNASCGGIIEVQNMKNGDVFTVDSAELLSGKTLQFDIHTPLLITAYALDNTQFEIWSEGATLKKIVDNGEEDTLAEDPVQYLKDFNGERTMVATFFCRPDQRPNPKWSYQIYCPVPTTGTNVDIPIT